MALPIDHEKRIVELLKRLRAEQSELNLVTAEANDWNRRFEPAKALYVDYNVAKRKADAIYEQYREMDDAMRPESEALNKAMVEARSKIQGTQTEMLDIFIEWMIRQ